MAKGTPIPSEQNGILYVYLDDEKVKDCDFVGNGETLEFIQPTEDDEKMTTVEELIAAGYTHINIETYEIIDLKKVLEKQAKKQ